MWSKGPLLGGGRSGLIKVLINAPFVSGLQARKTEEDLG